MIRRFVEPAPNCGHRGTTFSFHAIGEVWLCPACVASIGALRVACANCGLEPIRSTRLVHVHRAGLLCFSCRRDRLAASRQFSP